MFVLTTENFYTAEMFSTYTIMTYFYGHQRI